MATRSLHTPSQQLIDDAIEMLALCATLNDRDTTPTRRGLWEHLSELYVRWGRQPAPHRGAIDYLSGRFYVAMDMTGPGFSVECPGVKVTPAGRQALEYHRNRRAAS
jgi:hypothetical protein